MWGGFPTCGGFLIRLLILDRSRIAQALVLLILFLLFALALWPANAVVNPRANNATQKDDQNPDHLTAAGGRLFRRAVNDHPHPERTAEAEQYQHEKFLQSENPHIAPCLYWTHVARIRSFSSQ